MDWDGLIKQWKAVLEANARLGGDSSDLVIDRPATEDAVGSVESELGTALPASLREFFLMRSAKVFFSWCLPRHFRHPAPIHSGGLDLSLAGVVEAERGRRNWIEDVLSTREDPALQRGWDGAIAFHDTAIGDYLGIDLRVPGREQVIMLSHDEDRISDVVLGRDFQDFLVSWSAVGCAGPELFVLKPLLRGGTGPLLTEGAKASLWRRTMGL